MNNQSNKFDLEHEADNIIAELLIGEKDIISTFWKDIRREQRTALLLNIIDDPEIDEIVQMFLTHGPENFSGFWNSLNQDNR